MELKLTWIKLLSGFEINSNEQEKLWLEIVKNYSGKNRHYHNLSHLDKMITELNPVSYTHLTLPTKRIV